MKRVVSFVGFMLTREGRIESTLKLVYTDDKSRVDADLVDLIKVCVCIVDSWSLPPGYPALPISLLSYCSILAMATLAKRKRTKASIIAFFSLAKRSERVR